MNKDPREENNLWTDKDHTEIRESLTKQILDFLVHQDAHFVGKRGGEVLPPRWSS